MPTVNGGTLTISRGLVTISPDGTQTIQLIYSNAAGSVVHNRIVSIPASGASVTDQYGTVIVAPEPIALQTAASGYTAQLDTTIANGATAGKLNM
jgi:hypothetical protein